MRFAPHRIVSLATPLVLAALALVALLAGERLAAAAPLAGNVYVSADGVGFACSALVPCSLQQGVANTANGDTYVGTGSVLVTVTKAIT